MTRKNIQVLAAVVVALVLVILILNTNNHGAPGSTGRLLLQDFAQQADESQHISVIAAEIDPITIRRESGQWVVASRDDYPADISKLRQLSVALANAKILEEKTSNPDLYEKLDIDDPRQGGKGTMITIDGAGFAYSIVVGKKVQGDRRYVRVEGTEHGYLIDQSPDIPLSINGWLLPDIVNIDAKRVRKVTISHANGEAIIIEKSAEELTDFAVLDIPQGRELKYATVGNGVAAVLSDLDLEDVRAADEATPSTSSAVIQTWDGMVITATVDTDGESSWLRFSAEAPTEQTTESGDGISTPDADSAAIDVEIAKLNERLGGWQFKIANYKKDLLTRHFEDILKPLENNSK